MKICIDPGHGGKETGSVANGYIEKDLNLKTALLLKDKLTKNGFEVIMTRETDKELTLYERGQMSKDNNCELLISIHFNSFNGKAKGFECIYSFGSQESKQIGNSIKDEVIKLGLYDRGVWTKESTSYVGRNWYGVLRYSEPIKAIILEGLFLDNINDIQFLQQKNFLDKLATAYTIGICKYFGINYTKGDSMDWKSIIAEVTDSPEKWETAITVAVNAAKAEGDLGVLEIFEFLPTLIEKIYNKKNFKEVF